MLAVKKQDSKLSRILVAYSATATGRDALMLGIALASSQNMVLHLVMVSPSDSAFASAQPYDTTFECIRDTQLISWLDEAVQMVPDEIQCESHLVPSDSVADAICDSAKRIDADLLVVGSRPGGILRRHSLGSTTRHIIRLAELPVALAPTGYSLNRPIGRITAMFGLNRGATDVIGEAIRTAKFRGLPLRLASLVTDEFVRKQQVNSEPYTVNELARYANDRLEADASDLIKAGLASSVVATGKDVVDSMESLQWTEDEIILVASSRVANQGRIFLGKTVAKMLAAASLPVVVIPTSAPKARLGDKRKVAGHEN